MIVVYFKFLSFFCLNGRNKEILSSNKHEQRAFIAPRLKLYYVFFFGGGRVADMYNDICLFKKTAREQTVHFVESSIVLLIFL